MSSSAAGQRKGKKVSTPSAAARPVSGVRKGRSFFMFSVVKRCHLLKVVINVYTVFLPLFGVFCLLFSGVNLFLKCAGVGTSE